MAPETSTDVRVEVEAVELVVRVMFPHPDFPAGPYHRTAAEAATQTPPYPSTHNMGTCRMSARPEDGVVNGHGQAHDVRNLFVSDGSVFTSGAAANPTLTIVALAIRQAEYLAGEVGAGRI